MSRVYKILFDNGAGKKEMFAIKPFLGRFDDFKDEIFIRMPELKTKSLKFYYEDVDGDKITIFNTNDFAIFLEQSISKVFVEVQKPNVSVNFAPENLPWPTTSGAPQIFTPNFTAALSKPALSILKKLPSSASADDIRRHLHAGVICDICDKEIRGYRYKCLECDDFDLCMECEPSNHSQHLLLRIANPNDAEICYRAKLGKRFGRHRRSESLCFKPTEDRHHDKKGGHHDKKWHNKRHAACSRAGSFADVVSDILKSVAGPGAEVQMGEASGSNKVPKTATQENQNDQNATAMTTGEGPSTNFPTFPLNNQGNGKFKNHIDTLSNMAQHFAAMMDPFATYINETAANIANAQTPTTTPNSANEQTPTTKPKSARERIEDVLKILTPNNIDSVFEQMKEVNFNDVTLIFLSSLIIEKAINEPHLSEAYAKLCEKCWKSSDEIFGHEGGKSKFKLQLLSKLQYEFQTHVADENAIESKLLSMKKQWASDTNEHSKNVSYQLIQMEECKLRRRQVGLVRFIGELYRQDMVLTRIMEWCVNTLLSVRTDATLECLCNLLTTVGQKMETRTGDEESDKKNYRDLTPHFVTIRNIASIEGLCTISDHVRSMMLNLIQLRENNWVQSVEPMDGVNTNDETEKQTEPQTSNQSVAMVVDCSDDEEDSEHVLIKRVSIESSSDGSQSEKSNRGDSPSREWAFVDANDINELAQGLAPAEASTSTQGMMAQENDGSMAAKNTGTLPKQPKNQSQNAQPISDKPLLDYSELSRRLNDHIVSEKTATDESLAFSRVLEASKNQAQTAELSSASVTDGASRPSTDPRIIQAVNTMTAMGFSNEGGWLNQLLEAVNGDITSAIELMTPHK